MIILDPLIYSISKLYNYLTIKKQHIKSIKSY